MKPYSPSSPFCQRWTDRRHTWQHASMGGFDPARYTVEPIGDDTTARDYIVRHHYSGSYPSAKYRFGLYEAGSLVGVLVFGTPTSNSVLTNPFPDLEPNVESTELSRLVLADRVPANGESWFVARCFDEAAARGVRGVVAFADPVPRMVEGRLLFPGHVGIIYQALNGVLAGRSTPRTLTILPDGRVLNARSQQKVRAQERGHDHVERMLVELGARPMADEAPAAWLCDALRTLNATRLRHGGNWRYCFPIGTRAQKRKVRIGLPATPSYPKQPDLLVADQARAVVKRAHGNRGSAEDWTAELRREAGDVALVLLNVATLEGFDLGDVIAERLDVILARDLDHDPVAPTTSGPRP